MDARSKIGIVKYGDRKHRAPRSPCIPPTPAAERVTPRPGADGDSAAPPRDEALCCGAIPGDPAAQAPKDDARDAEIATLRADLQRATEAVEWLHGKVLEAQGREAAAGAALAEAQAIQDQLAEALKKAATFVFFALVGQKITSGGLEFARECEPIITAAQGAHGAAVAARACQPHALVAAAEVLGAARAYARAVTGKHGSAVEGERAVDAAGLAVCAAVARLDEGR